MTSLKEQYSLQHNQQIAQTRRNQSAIALELGNKPAQASQTSETTSAQAAGLVDHDNDPEHINKSTFLAQGRHQVSFRHQKGQWWGSVHEHLPSGFSRAINLPVYWELGLGLEAFAQYPTNWQQRRIHVCFPEQDLYRKGYIYIGSLGLWGGGAVHLDVENIINTMIMGHSFISPRAVIPNDMVTGWRDFLQEIANTLASVDINLNTSNISPDPNLQRILEMTMNRHMEGRRMQLGNYDAAYHHVASQVKEQIRQSQSVAIDPATYPINSYAVTFDVNVFSMMALMPELSKVFSVAPGNNAVFDLGNLLNAVTIRLNLNPSFYAHEQEVRAQQQAERSHRNTENAWLMGDNSDIGDQLLQRKLIEQNAELEAYQKRKEEQARKQQEDIQEGKRALESMSKAMTPLLKMQLPLDISRPGVQFIAKHEGCFLKAYNDIAGKATIGYGHLIKQGEDFSKGLTHEEALELFKKDLQIYVKGVNRHVAVPLFQHEFDALTSLTYNIGEGLFSGSTLLQRVNANNRDREAITEGFLKFQKAKVAGVFRSVQGLINRRKREAVLFLDGSY